MHNLPRFSSAAAAGIAFAVFAPSALAQENTTVWSCQDVGASQPEPLGDREGHSISVSHDSCRTDSGPLAGSVETGTSVWEWDGPKAFWLRRRPKTGRDFGISHNRGKPHTDDDRRQSDRLYGLGTRRHCVGDRRMGTVCRQVHLDGKISRPGVAICA
jgi:hypothetical protein